MLSRIAVIICLAVSLVAAQSSIKWRGSNGWGIGSRYEQLYNNFSLQTITGKINKIDTTTPMSDMAQGIQLLVKTDREEVPVLLGPSWYVLHQDMNLDISDQIEVKGMRTSVNGKQAFIASEVRRKDRILRLRDQDGIPYWCAWRKR